MRASVDSQPLGGCKRVDERTPRVGSVGTNQNSCTRGNSPEDQLLGKIQLAGDVNRSDVRAMDPRRDSVAGCVRTE